ncbi:KIAA1217 [Phyllostomus discolor]|uniref:KIAA1217 n=1 Tax=Phyllostomus discolor TaxID=89673 RepID=A0A834BGU9_9CHIR|nr:KIAA1217 [Phyllostomus discolor]
MQTSEMDRKREAFLEHLKQKYPHHATAIMGHQERLRDQTRSPKLSHSPQPPSLGEPVEHLSETSGDSLEAMSEGEAPSPFSRGSRTRASLPVVRTTNQTKERSLECWVPCPRHPSWPKQNSSQWHLYHFPCPLSSVKMEKMRRKEVYRRK